MAKELPYYKHEPSEWLEGEIQACSDAAIVCFTNLRDGYWLKLGCISYAFALHKYCRKDASVIQELIDNGIIDLDGDEIRIRFLDKQLKEFNSISDKRKDAANKRWGSGANALQVQSKSNAIRGEERREDKKKEEEIILLKKIKKKKIVDYSVPFEERRAAFRESLREHEPEYGIQMVENFYLYWAEKTSNENQMRFEMIIETKKTWELKLRLARWHKNNFDNGKRNSTANDRDAAMRDYLNR